jgi:hypothetical protein
MDRTRAVAGSLILVASFAGCRTPRTDTTGLKDTGTATSGSMIECIERDRLDISDLPTALLSEVWTDVSARTDGKQAQMKFLTGILASVLPMLKGTDLSMVISDSFGIPPQSAQAILSGIPDGTEQAFAAALAVKLIAVVEKDPDTLDRFPTIRLSEMGEIQKALFAAGKYQSSPPAARAFRIDTAAKPVTIRAKGCDKTPTKIIPFMPEIGLDKRWFPLTRNVTPCFHENNIQLAQALNALSNLVVNETPALTVSFDADGDGTGAASSKVSSYEDLLTLFADAGIRTEIYLKRQVANFLGLYYNAGGTSKTVRSPVWFGAEMQGALVRIPSEHSEVAMVFYKNGERLAQVRYYLGTPAAGFENTPSFWRPVFEYDALWSFGEYESVQALEPQQLVNKARNLLYGTAKTMLAYQAVHDRFRLPANAYGIFICSDSVVTAVAAAESLGQGRISDRRATNAYPLLRMKTFTPPGESRAIDVEQMIATYAGIDTDAFSKVYPSDIALQQNRASLQARLRTAFSPAVDDRYALYPEFLRQLKQDVRSRQP